jgi:hypothetical protein
MGETKIIDTLLTQFGFAGLLVVAVYIIARKLAGQYELRITALESASARCEADRVDLWNVIISMQTKVIADLTAKLNHEGDAETR